MSLRPARRYAVPVGSSWEETAIDEAAVSRYRFYDLRHARLKARLDIAAGAYLALVAAALIAGGGPSAPTATALLAFVGDGYALRPLYAGLLPRSFRAEWAALAVFALLLCAVLLHESRWLKLHIYYEYLTSPLAYEGFLPSKLRKRPLTSRQRAWTLASTFANWLAVLGVLTMAARYLWAARLLPQVRDPLLLAGLVFGGILLAVIGATAVVGALDGGATEAAPVFVRAFLCAVVSGGAFVAILALGLARGEAGGRVGFGFGFGLALSALLCRDLVVRPRRGRVPERLKRLARPLAHVPLIALGRVIDRPLAWALSVVSPRRKLPPQRPGENWTIYEQVGSGGGQSWGRMHRPKPLPWRPTRADAVRRWLLLNLLREDSWLTRWLKREPVRLRQSHLWEMEDPLDFRHRTRTVGGYMPPLERADELNRRLLSLMLAAFFVAYVVELVIGHAVALAGRPLLERGAWAALAFGLGTGALFAFASVFGHSSFGALTVGLVSGLSLDPTTGLGSGLLFRLSHDGLFFALTFVLTLVLDTLDRRALWAAGFVALGAGGYLQALPRLVPN